MAFKNKKGPMRKMEKTKEEKVTEVKVPVMEKTKDTRYESVGGSNCVSMSAKFE